MRKGVVFLFCLVVSGCLAEETEVPQPGPTTPESLSALKQACERRGGSFAPASPGSPLRTCVFETSDANQRCASGGDCEGVCLARSQTCAPVIPLMGCHDILRGGGLVETQCRQ